MSKFIIPCALLASIGFAGCGQKTTPAQVPVEQPPAEQASAVQTPAAAATPPDDSDMAIKQKAMEFALQEDAIKNDPKGQWAIKALASSTYASDSANPQDSYHPMQATGAPNVPAYGDDEKAWASKESDTGIEWLELEYANAVNASMVRVRQTLGPGSIVKIEVFDAAGAPHTIFNGPDSTQYTSNQISWLTVPIKPAPIKTQKVKITLATNMVSGWNEIDAVQLISE